MRLPKQAQAVIRVRVPIEMTEDIGLGDVIKRLTSTLGVDPCGGCERRAAALNRRIIFTGRNNMDVDKAQR